MTSTAQLIHDTTIVTAVNGIPYWYFHRHGGGLEGRTLDSIDPGAAQWETLRPERALGCIVYPATEVAEPGVIQHVYGDKFPLGDGKVGPITQRLTRAYMDIVRGVDSRFPEWRTPTYRPVRV